jgi:hypothetical protein
MRAPNASAARVDGTSPVRTFLKLYMELGSYFLFLQEQIKDIIIMHRIASRNENNSFSPDRSTLSGQNAHGRTSAFCTESRSRLVLPSLPDSWHVRGVSAVSVMMMSFIWSCRNKNQPKAIYPKGTSHHTRLFRVSRRPALASCATTVRPVYVQETPDLY